VSDIASPQALTKAAQHLAAKDPALKRLVDLYGIPTITPHKNYYQELVESIISQQLSVKAASTILRRFVELFPIGSFPSPEAILTKDIETLRAVGLSRQKASYIQDLAVKVIDGTVHFDHLDSLSNNEVISELTQIKGVGTWTVHMFLMFCMGRLDVLPVGDLGIKNGMIKTYSLPEKPTEDEMKQVALDHSWHPYETVASWYLWRSLDVVPVV